MAHTEVLYLFPEYEDSPKATAEYLLSRRLMDSEEINSMFELIRELFGFICYEVRLNFYDSNNVEAFFYPINVMGKSTYPHGFERSLKSRIVKSFKMHNIRDACYNTLTDGSVFERNHVVLREDALCIISKRQNEDKDSAFLIVDCDAYNEKITTDTIISKSHGYKSDFDVKRFDDKKSIAEWFFHNRKPVRTIDKEYGKHGETGKGGWKRGKKGEVKSCLLCSEEEAEQLLKCAIGEQDNSTLFWFDKERKLYIKFMYENTDSLYHAYHLKSKKEIEKIPQEVKNKIQEWFPKTKR